MAKILISYHKQQEWLIAQNAMLGFWEGFVRELKHYGNEVLVVNTSYFNSYGTNEVSSKKMNYAILDRVKAFSPDLVITFNHRIPKCILDHCKDIPVVIWDGDEIKYFCDLPYIKANIARYTVLSIVKEWRQSYIDFGFAPEKIHYLLPATAVHANDVKQTLNISFLGQWHYDNGVCKQLIKAHSFGNRFGEIVRDFLCSPSYKYRESFAKYFADAQNCPTLNDVDLYPLYDYRWLTLANLLDLGLRIYGDRWDLLIDTMPQLVAAFDSKRIWTLSENSDLYNASKISLCPMHPQAVGSGFAWRAFDIMAANSCLVMGYSSEMKDATNGKVDIPMFKTPWEARELVVRLLADDSARSEIVAQSQAFVDASARWVHRFKDIESITGIHLVNNSKCTFEQTSIEKKDLLLNEDEINRLAVQKLRATQPSASRTLKKTLFPLAHTAGMMSAGVINKCKSAHIRAVSSAETAYRIIKSDSRYLQMLERIQRKRESGKKIKVVFLVVFGNVFQTKSLYLSMLKDPMFDPEIAVIPDTLRGDSHKISQSQTSFNALRSLPGTVFQAYNTDSDTYTDLSDRYDIAVFNNPYDKMTHRNYSVRYLSAKMLCIYASYFYYGRCLYERRVAASLEYALFWKIFIENEENKNDIARLSVKHGRNLVVTGYMKMDEIANINRSNRARKRIIIAPHHTIIGAVRGLCLSNFIEYKDFILELPGLYPNIDFVFRPHPLLFVNLLNSHKWTNREINEYVDSVREIPNMEFDSSSDYFGLFVNSDGLIHDCGSFLSEYMYTGHPQCYVLRNDIEEKFNFTEGGIKMLSHVYKAHAKGEIIHFIDTVIVGGNDTMREDRERFANADIKFGFPSATQKAIDLLKHEFTDSDSIYRHGRHS